MKFLPRLRLLLSTTLFASIGFSVSAEDPLMQVEEDEARIVLLRDGKTILSYNKQPTEEAAKHEPFFNRTGYIHPLYAPSGRVVTGDFAPDHKHQHGLFFAWTRTRFEKREPEFWNQKLQKGTVAYQGTVETFEGPERCGFEVLHLWTDDTAPDGPKPVLEERWTVTAHDSGDDRFVFDVESQQVIVGEKPLTIRKYHYGGMAIRGNAQWLGDEEAGTPVGTMLTSEGLGREEGNHSRPRWVVMQGPIDGENSGVAVLSHPGNFRAPQWVRLHPTKPYFVWAPMVEEPFSIEPGEPYQSSYRYVVFDGPADPDAIEAEWKSWSAEGE